MTKIEKPEGIYTTSEIFGKLKVDQEATDTSNEYRITKLSDGSIVHVVEKGFESRTLGNFVSTTSGMMELSWCLEPILTAVSGVEAMKALDDGFTVLWYPEYITGSIEITKGTSLRRIGDAWTHLTWDKFLNSKWAVKDYFRVDDNYDEIP